MTLKDVKIGLALGSGAARGWAHIGVLRVLLANDIPIDVIAGSSIGAIVGAAQATGALDALHERVRALTFREVLTMLDYRGISGGLVGNASLMKELADIGITGRIEALPIPFMAIATDLVSGREMWLREGDLSSALRASSAIPGIFAPVRLNGCWMIDGGLVDPVPVVACRSLGADIVIAVDLSENLTGRQRLPQLEHIHTDTLNALADRLPAVLGTPLRWLAPERREEPGKPGYFDVMAQALNIMTAHITRARLSGHPPQVLIRPPLLDIDTFDFDKGHEAILEGERAARAALPHIRATIAAYTAPRS
ncbi:MAG TPA: patatin [Thermopetrobacter sp.]|nr:patatin [Thermopetrobacter sp.]